MSAPVDRSRLARRSRNKGSTFERLVVNLVKERFASLPWAEKVRRSDQGFGARLSDVPGWPGIWAECQDAADPTPEAKIRQSIEDWAKAGGQALGSIPIAIWHRIRAREIRVRLRLCDLQVLTASQAMASCEQRVDLTLGHFFDLYEMFRETNGLGA